MENLMLLDISNKTAFNVLTNIHLLNYNIYDYRELIHLASFLPQLRYLLYDIFVPLKSALQNLDRNVSFVNIDNVFVKNSCDWCSIVNGIMETAKQNIINQPELVKHIDFERLNYPDNYFDIVLLGRTEKVTAEQVETWCSNTFGQVTPGLLLFSRIYLKLEQIELRWCPFKRSKEFYYRNRDKRYLELTEQTMYEVGKILSKYETITCNNCPLVINAEWKYTKNNEDSMFQPLLDYMMREIREPAVPRTPP
jgi:hypothetical protein